MSTLVAAVAACLLAVALAFVVALLDVSSPGVSFFSGWLCCTVFMDVRRNYRVTVTRTDAA